MIFIKTCCFTGHLQKENLDNKEPFQELTFYSHRRWNCFSYCSQRQRLINTTETRVNRITNGDSESAARSQGRRGLENGMGGGSDGRGGLQRLESGNETENENEDNENNENDEEGEEVDDRGGPLVPFKVPGTVQTTCRETNTLCLYV